MNNLSSLPSEFEVSFTIQAINEAARMSRRWYFWPLYVLRNPYGFGVIALLVFGGLYMADKSLLSSAPDISRASAGLLMAAGPTLLYWWLFRRNARKAADALTAINPLKLQFNAEGLQTTEKEARQISHRGPTLEAIGKEKRFFYCGKLSHRDIGPFLRKACHPIESIRSEQQSIHACLNWTEIFHIIRCLPTRNPKSLPLRPW